MKRIIYLFFFTIVFLQSGSGFAADKLRVVATIPDLADIAQRIGGDLVEVTSLATGVEDPHAVPMKPSFAILLNRADAVVLQGLDLEHAFLPGLLDASRNNKIQRDAPGYIDCSVHVLPLEVPTRIDRSLGEQHPLGNPHFNLDPINGKKIALAIEEGFARILPEHAADFKANLSAYEQELDQLIAKWASAAAILKGVKFVSYHPDFAYLAQRYGMVESGTIELKAGVDPTPSHVEELINSMQQGKVGLVIRERHYPATLAQTVAEKTGATLVELPILTHGVPEAKNYLAFIDYNLTRLVDAVKSRGESK